MVNLARKSSAEDSKDYDDEVKSIDFTPDPNAMKVLQIKPPKKGDELDALNAEKIYRYQLEIDMAKLVQKKGSYASRALSYMMQRYQDPKYNSVAFSTSKIGVEGATEEVAQVTREISWRATARPEGVIAAKRFQEWLNGTPKGPSEAFVKDKEQRKQDNALWENIKYDRLQKSKKQERLERKLRAEEYARQKKEEKERIEAEKEAIRMGRTLGSKAELAAGAIKQENILANRFADNRIVPTEGGKQWSLKEWNKGHHYKDAMGNIERTFPVRTVVAKEGVRANSEVVKVADDGTWFDPPPPSTEKYIKLGDNAEWAYITFIMEKNVNRAENFLKERARMKKEYARKLDRERRAEERRQEKAELAAKEQAERIAAGLEEESGSEYETDNDEEAKGEGEGEGEGGEGGNGEGNGELGNEDEARPAEDESAEGKEQSDSQVEGGPSLEASESAAGGSGAGVGVGEKEGGEAKSEKKKKKKKKKEVKAVEADDENLDPAPSKAEVLRTCLSALPGRVGSALKSGAVAVGSRVKKQVRRSWSVFRLVVKHGRDYENFLHTLNSDGSIEAPKAEAEPEKEPWELPPGHEFRLTRKERKYLERLKSRILEERRLKWEEENSEDAIQKRLLAEKEANRVAKFSIMHVWQDFVAYLTGTVPEYKKSKAQKLMESRAKQAAAELKEEAGNEAVMNMLFSVREKQRAAEQFYRDVKAMFLGGSNDMMDEEFQVDDLIREARAGNYNTVMDLMDHPMTPIGPNDANPDGVSAFFVCMTMILNNEGADVSADLVDLSLWQRFWRFINKKAGEAKLDLTMRILMHRGGDINYRKKERDGDGLAIIHMAAESGATNMISWLSRKKALINIPSLNLKRTALMYACRADKLEAVMQLLKLGGMLVINDKDVNGWTALHFAASFASSELAMVLMLCGAKINARNERGLLAQEEAMARGRAEMVETVRTFKSVSADWTDRMAFVNSFYPLPDFNGNPPPIQEVADEESAD